MKIYRDIPFALDTEAVLDSLRCPADSREAASIGDMIEKARKIARPKAVYEVCYVTGRSPGRIEINDVWFDSPVLAHNLANVERVFAFVATCGREVDEAGSEERDMLLQYYWGEIKELLLRQAIEYLTNHIQHDYGLNSLASMNPGSGDMEIWPIEQQRGLFEILREGSDDIGVELTPTCLMIPSKSISGLFFPSERKYRNCQLCRRESCPSRIAPFDPDLWEDIHAR